MKYLLDTNILIYLLKRQPPHVAVRMDALPPEAQVGMSFVTWAELLKGVQRSARPDDTRQQLDRQTDAQRLIAAGQQRRFQRCRQVIVRQQTRPNRMRS